jgi:uncharacterized protein (TIGR03435 family)
MAGVRLSKLEFSMTEKLWSKGGVLIREIQDRNPGKKRPMLTSMQKVVFCLETNGDASLGPTHVNFHMFEPAIARKAALRAKRGGPSFAQAMKEQLGLKLESTKGLVEMLVIDRRTRRA